jgi:putative protein-disulfide isomerase
MRKTLHYVFDPLCGWCYGASGLLGALAEMPELVLELHPSGLFAGEGARPMDEGFATYAWANDQRIERLTGQQFSQRYRTEVLGARGRLFDSGPATVALTAVWRTAPEHEAQALQALQRARYVDGRDVTDPAVLSALLMSLGLPAAAQQLQAADAGLLQDTQARIARARDLMRQVGVQGVPAIVLERRGSHEVLSANGFYHDPRAFLDRLAAA